MQYYFKGYGNIFVDSVEAESFIEDYLQRDEYEYEYYPKGFIRVVEKLEPENLKHTLEYMGKYEPDLEGLLAAAQENGINFLAMSAPRSDYGDYDQSSVEYVFSAPVVVSTEPVKISNLTDIFESAYRAGVLGKDYDVWFNEELKNFKLF